MRGENENVAYDGDAVDVANEKDKEALRIDAPPEAAKSMAIMFEAMAQLMRSAG